MKKRAREKKTLAPVSPGVEQGLSSQQVQERLEGGWSNQVTAKQGLTEGQIVLRHCVTFFNLVFVVMAVVLALCGSSVKNMTFMIVVIINTAIGIVQQIRAKRAVDKLTLVAARTVKTVRDGQLQEVRSDLLVRDDVVEFSTGDQICADGILRSGQLGVNESLITGEPDTVPKAPGDTLRSGSFVVSGRARVQLTQVGDDAFAARLTAEAKKDPKAAKSEMMYALDRLIRVVGIALIPIGLILFWHEFYSLRLGLTESAEAVVAALVGMIPEGLYLLTSVAMAVSALKLTRQRVLVQDMNCIESLARVDVLCVDKTGTITEPEMSVEKLIPLSDVPAEPVLAALYGSREPDNDTARALAAAFGTDSDWVCQTYIPFSSETKWSGGVFAGQGTFVCGAPEFILGSRYDTLSQQVQQWSAQGYRVLLLASYAGTLPGELLPQQVTPLALILLTNRIRAEAPQTFEYFARQGVRIKVISGDDPRTVSQVARRAGIAGAEKYVDANTLQTDEAYLQAAQAYTVFGRVTPDQKKRLIRALKQCGHTVAMTGDGVNDVLAMKEADCSVAMASGAQAASQVAHMVLLDSHFSAMPQIVGEGRRVINNIQRSATLFLVKNIFSLLLSVITVFTGWAYPFAPLNLTVISTLTIGTPAFFLALEPNYERVRGRFLPQVLRRALPGGLTDIVMILIAQILVGVFGLPQAQVGTVCTAVLAAVGMSVLFQVSRPFDTFRKVIWGAMAAGLLLGFTVLRGFLDLPSDSTGIQLLMALMLITAPTVYFIIGRAIDWCEKIFVKNRHVNS